MPPTTTETPPTTETTDKPALNPFVQSILDSTGKVLGPDPDALPPEPEAPHITLGEAVEISAQKSAAPPPVTPPTPEVTAPAAPAPAPTPAPTPAPAAKVVRRKIPEPEPKATPSAPEAPVPAPTAPPDDDYIKGLTEAQREEYELALFAEKSKPGIAAQTLEFFKKTDAYISEHPDNGAESEEFGQFLKENKPKWSEPERRRLEREKIKAEVTETVRKDLTPELTAAQRRIAEMETRPVIDQAVSQVSSVLSEEIARNEGETDEDYRKRTAELPTPIDKDVVEKVKANYAEAVKDYPVEAPIVQGTLIATREWIALRRGTAQLDANNPTHAWLMTFVAQEGANMLKQPAEVRTLPDGRTFIPLHEYMTRAEKDPGLAAKHWTHTDDMIVDMLAANAVLTANQQIKAMERAGFKREPRKVSAQAPSSAPVQPAAPAPNPPVSSGSPRAGAGHLPGAVEGELASSPHAAFLESLCPGAGKAAVGA